MSASVQPGFQLAAFISITLLHSAVAVSGALYLKSNDVCEVDMSFFSVTCVTCVGGSELNEDPMC